MTSSAPSRISEIYLRDEPVFSFEFFPPKTDKGAENLMQTAVDLAQSVQPDFISVTYGAGGSTRDRTHQIVTRIQSELGVTGMAHLTCVGATSDEIGDVVGRLEAAGAQRARAAWRRSRGDGELRGHGRRLRVRLDLIAFLSEHHDVCIGGALLSGGAPRGDLGGRGSRLREDQAGRRGLSFTTQLFDVGLYNAFVERARAAGITIPIVPGIMPVTNVSQVERFTRMWRIDPRGAARLA